MPNIPFGQAGSASFQSDQYAITPLFSGDGIDVTSESLAFSPSVVALVPAFTVLELSPTGVQPAKLASGNPLIGILAEDYDPTISTLFAAPVLLSGIYNPLALNFDPSFATYAQKQALFATKVPILMLQTIGSPAS